MVRQLLRVQMTEEFSDTANNASEKFSDQVNKAIEKLSWQALEDFLNGVDLVSKDIDKLVGLARRNESLVLKRIDERKQSKRDKFLRALADYLDDKGFPTQAEFVHEHSVRLKEVDAVYHSILMYLQKTDAWKLAPELRVSAVLEGSNRLLAQVHKQIGVDMVVSGHFDQCKVTARDEAGNEFDPNALHELIVQALANTLGMEAHINGWYDKQDVLVLPGLPAPTEGDLVKIRSVQLLATSWRHWQFSERRYRYLNAPLVRHTDFEANAALAIKAVWQSNPNDDDIEVYSLAANIRLMERFQQNLVPIESDAEAQRMVCGINGDVKLFPDQAVSINEIHGALELGQLLSTDITDHEAEYAGLTLAEWLRGYSVLQAISLGALNTVNADRMTMRFSEAELVEILQRLGLYGPKAQLFIGYATYRKASRDLFDQPLIKVSGSGYILLALTAGLSSIPKVVLSTLGMLKVSLDTRGKRFEKSMIRLLRSHGFNAKTITSDLQGEIYDYDVAFVWGDYLFLFECKSRSLPTSDPARIYFHSLGIDEVVKQVNRLAEGIKKHPEILRTHMPEAVEKKVVYCVVNSLPFAKYTEEGEIHFADESGIAEFFEQSEMTQNRPGIKASSKPIDPTSIHTFLWDGAKPTPEDFLRYLRTPVQLGHATYHLVIKPIDIHVGEEEALQLMDFQVTNRTIGSLQEASRLAGYRTGCDVRDEAR